MEHVTDARALVITGTPLLSGFDHPSIHTHRALDQCDAFFRWCSEYPEAPIKGLLNPVHVQAIQQWRELIMAQSMDMFADSGLNASNWRSTLVEALSQVAHLSGPAHHSMVFSGFEMDFQRIPGPEIFAPPPPETAILPANNPIPALVSLTMEDASRGLSGASACLGDIIEALEDLSPAGTRVEHSMLASALLTLIAMGPMTGYSLARVGGPADPWHALMAWNMPKDLATPRKLVPETMAGPIA